MAELTRKARILILAKTYPSPSAKYAETSCVAGISDAGEALRLYPVPFRLIDSSEKFRKWQWIEASICKADRDHRPESHRISVGTIVPGDVVDTGGEWSARKEWLNRLPTFTSFRELAASSREQHFSLALLKPARIEQLEIRAARHSDWTDDEREKLERAYRQDDLFSAQEAKQEIRQLRKIPFDFYYHCSYVSGDSTLTERHKIVDWEAGALYWNCVRSHGDGWEAPFRAKLESELVNRDLMFLMGNLHRFQDQWLIVSLFYPPKPAPESRAQQSLF